MAVVNERAKLMCTCSQPPPSRAHAVLEFNAFDLYSKGVELVDVDAVWPFYQGLIDKWLPGYLLF